MSSRAGAHAVTLPSRSVLCEAPIPRHGRPGGDVLPSEESASFIMWAWPRLLGWPRTVNWLFSPVVGNKKYPGDLWGLDSDGNLLIVETKLDRGRSQDPFFDFLPYSASFEARRRCRSEELRAHWEPLVGEEERFLRMELPRLTPRARPVGVHRGVLPYSVHRDATWRWQKLYRARIAPLFRGRHYRRAVERGLRLREARRDPPPIFVGLIASVAPRSPRLSPKGAAAMRDLRGLVGPDFVFLRMLLAGRAGGLISVGCSTPEVDAER